VLSAFANLLIVELE